MDKIRSRNACVQRAVWRNGGRSPQKRQCEFGSLYPAESSVEAATTPSRPHVRRHFESAVRKLRKIY